MEPIKPLVFYGKRYNTLGAAVEAVSLQDSSADMVIIPPDVDQQTDEEDIDEDVIMNTDFPIDVPREMELHHDATKELEEDWKDEDNLHLSELKKSLVAPKRQKMAIEPPKWTKEVIDITMKEIDIYTEILEKLKTDLRHFQPVDIFEMLFDEPLLLNQNVTLP